MGTDRSLPDVTLRAGALALALLAMPLAAQEAPGDYRTLLEHELDKAPAQIDFLRLRQAYAGSPQHDGTIRLQGEDTARDPAAIEAAALEDFPLLDTHLAAIALYDTMGSRQAVLEHRQYAEGILSAILAGRTEVEGRMVFPVLSAGEAQAVLAELGVRSTGESEVALAGRPHACHEVEPDPAHTPHTDDPPLPAGPVCFDITATAG